MRKLLKRLDKWQDEKEGAVEQWREGGRNQRRVRSKRGNCVMAEEEKQGKEV